jgi:hypothetical protein
MGNRWGAGWPPARLRAPGSPQPRWPAPLDLIPVRHSQQADWQLSLLSFRSHYPDLPAL